MINRLNMRQLSFLGLSTILCFSLVACDSGEGDDLDQFMANAMKNVPVNIPPLPKVQIYEPMQFDIDHKLTDPFKTQKTIGRAAPDINRPREPLEAFTLESLKYVGYLSKNKMGKNITYGLVKTTDKTVQQVKRGDHLGVNYGVVTSITEAEIKVKEQTLDSVSGEWEDHMTSLTLQE